MRPREWLALKKHHTWHRAKITTELYTSMSRQKSCMIIEIHFLCSLTQYPKSGDVDYEDHDDAWFACHPPVACCGCHCDCGIWPEVLERCAGTHFPGRNPGNPLYSGVMVAREERIASLAGAGGDGACAWGVHCPHDLYPHHIAGATLLTSARICR